MRRPDASDGERRRQARAEWPVVVRRLDASDDDISATTTATERVAMTWRLAGKPIPTYDRAHTPSRVFRAGKPRPDDAES
jgi:hypothetical protein